VFRRKNLSNTDELCCKECGSTNVQKRGYTEKGERRIQCNDCKEWSCYEGEETGSYAFIEEGEKAFASASLDEDVVNSPKKLLAAMKIDGSVWRVYKKEIGKSVAWRKDKKSSLKFNQGVATGEVEDSGKIKIVPIYTVKLWLERKTPEIRENLAIEDFQKLAYKFSPKQVSLKLPKRKDGMLYEIEMPDLHIGKLTWGEETGEDSDIKIQTKSAKSVLEQILSHTKNYPIEKIWFPIGHDYFNVDNQFNTTTHGTPQQEDTRWRKTFKIGWTFAAEMINMCAQVAPVEVIVIPGNHDETRSYYLGEVLSALYEKSRHICVDNSAKARKYKSYGINLIGMTHGYYEPLKRLKDLMTYEAPDLWAQSKYREFHTGDKHHKEDYVQKTDETDGGIVVRILRSLSPADAWHYNKGYVGALRASEAFLWHKTDKLVAQFTASPK
jgi:hypothetical protein